MADRSSITYISSALGGNSSGRQIADSLRKQYPFFVPVRYIEARHSYRAGETVPLKLAEVLPYAGNWLMLCEFLKGTQKEAVIMIEAEPAEIGESADAITVAENVPEIDIPALIEVAAEKAIEADIAEAISAPAGNADIDEPIAEPLIEPLYAHDYFLHNGEKISDEMPDSDKSTDTEEDKSLMVMMSFSEWLLHFKKSSEDQDEEVKDQKALKTMWQKEKLAAALEEENEEIPEKVFEMAVNSISMEDGLASETLADLYIKQGKYEHAIEMYRKLSLRNPQKNAYFARKIEEALKDKQS